MKTLVIMLAVFGVVYEYTINIPNIVKATLKRQKERIRKYERNYNYSL